MLCLLLLPILGVQVEPEAVADKNSRTASNFDAHALQFHVENEKKMFKQHIISLLVREIQGSPALIRWCRSPTFRGPTPQGRCGKG